LIFCSKYASNIAKHHPYINYLLSSIVVLM
jgi:hypothetical protein